MSSRCIENGDYRFTVKVGTPPESAKNGTKLARGANFQCVMSELPIAGDYIKAEGIAGRMNAKLMAIVAGGDRGRVYLAPTPEHESIAHGAEPTWMPDVEIPPDRRSMFTPLYGLTHFKHLFTDRQLVALTTFSDLALEKQGSASDKTPVDDRYAGRRYAACRMAATAPQLTPRQWACIWRLPLANTSDLGKQLVYDGKTICRSAPAPAFRPASGLPMVVGLC